LHGWLGLDPSSDQNNPVLPLLLRQVSVAFRAQCGEAGLRKLGTWERLLDYALGKQRSISIYQPSKRGHHPKSCFEADDGLPLLPGESLIMRTGSGLSHSPSLLERPDRADPAIDSIWFSGGVSRPHVEQRCRPGSARGWPDGRWRGRCGESWRSARAS